MDYRPELLMSEHMTKKQIRVVSLPQQTDNRFVREINEQPI